MLKHVAILLAIASLACSGSAGAQAVPDWARNYSAAEYGALKDENIRLARAYALNDRQIDQIARTVIGRSANVSFPQLLARIESSARNAANLANQVQQLTRKIADLEAKYRDPAQQILETAKAALAEGRFDDAGAAFGKLSVLRNASGGDAIDAWVAAVNAQADVAVVQLDFDKARSLRLAAEEEEKQASDTRRWLLRLKAADDDLAAGNVFGDRLKLERAINDLRDVVLPLAPRDRRPADWGSTQSNLCVAIESLAELGNDPRAYDPAEAACRAALEVRTTHDSDWASTQLNLGNVLARRGGLSGDMADLRAAEAAFADAAKVYTREFDRRSWVDVQTNRGGLLTIIGAQLGDRTILDAAVLANADALEIDTPDANLTKWAELR